MSWNWFGFFVMLAIWVGVCVLIGLLMVWSYFMVPLMGKDAAMLSVIGLLAIGMMIWAGLDNR